jgi:hypothetical protein
MPATPYIAFDPGSGLAYGVGLSPAEARDDAEFQAGVIQGGSQPWRSLATRACTLDEARRVVDGNGPQMLDRPAMERAS